MMLIVLMQPSTVEANTVEANKENLPEMRISREVRIKYPFSATPTLYDTLKIRSIITEKGLVVPPEDYTFSPGDVVVIRLSGRIPYEYETVVDYDGYVPIYFPTGKTGNYIKISDISYDSLKSYLRKNLRGFLKGYSAHVFLKSPAIFPVRIEGEVINIYDIYVDGLMRLHEVLRFVPLKPTASRDRFLIFINDTSFMVDLTYLYSLGDLFLSPLLKPNMKIKVLRDSSFCTVFVRGAYQVSCKDGETIISVFRKSVFMDPTYQPVGFVIKRDGFRKLSGDEKVRVGDTILPIIPIDSVYVSGNVNYPKALPFVPTAPVAYYVSQVGGFRDNAVIGKYTLVSRNGKNMKVDDRYIPLPGDVIYVDKTFVNFRELLIYSSSLVGTFAALLNTYMILRRK